jgi:hypothetical protein
MLVNEICLYYDARSKKHQNIMLLLLLPTRSCVTHIKIRNKISSSVQEY